MKVPKKKKFAFWYHILFLVFAVNYIIVRQVQLTFYAQNCISKQQVQSDSRCLYTYYGKVYDKGSRNNPHKDNPCGSDVTTILPSSHSHNAIEYLDPNLVGAVCSDVSTPTPTPTPANAPTSTPTVTRKPVQKKPTSTLTPTPTKAIPVVLSPNNSGFGKYIPGGATPQEAAPLVVTEKKISVVVLWSEILVAISFMLLIIVSVVGVIKKLWGAPPRRRS